LSAFFDASDPDVHWLAWKDARVQYLRRDRTEYPVPDRLVVETLSKLEYPPEMTRHHFRENGWMDWPTAH
jgi:hypothetical protein